MSRIRQRDTAPELRLVRSLRALGHHPRRRLASLPCRPDLLFIRARVAVFVHGCFWHSHPGCKAATVPKTRNDYWIPKLAANVERDQRQTAALRALGWRVLTVWECETKNAERLAQRAADIAEIVRQSLAGETEPPSE